MKNLTTAQTVWLLNEQQQDVEIGGFGRSNRVSEYIKLLLKVNNN